jgi:phosphoglycolate phosphatase-like HAD superfamily hydrolase
MVNLFVWDFHGVLEKDNEHAVVEVTNQVLKEFKQTARLDMETCLALYGKKWGLYYKQLCPDLDEDTIMKMVERGIEISKTTDVIFRHVKPMEFSHEVLAAIRKAKHENMIVSNTEPNALDRYLDAVKIKHFINHKIGADSHRKYPHSKNSKIQLLKDFLKQKDYDKIIVIGDTETDIELGKSVGAVTYLFSRANKHPKISADFKITDLREILKEL